MRTIFLTWLSSILWTLPAMAQTTPEELNNAGIYKFNEELEQTFEDILHLKLKKARLAMPALKQKNTFNLMPHYVEWR
jgi:hypothetical protein